MKKFNFRLETVLKLKEKALSDKLLELAKITKILQEEEEKLGSIKTRMEEINNNLIESFNGSDINIIEIQTSKGFLIKLGNEAKNQKELLKQINRAIQERQKEVQEALKEKNILEKLKEKQSKKHYDEFMYKEAVELDDIAISRYKAG